MTGWAETDWRARAAALPPGAQAALVLALGALTLAVVPGVFVDSMVNASGLPARLSTAPQQIGLPGRVLLCLAGGLVAALLFALLRWKEELRRSRRPGRIRVAICDNPLAVEPLAAARDLGPRFDDSPYLVSVAPNPPAPPTPDARIDPDSTMGDPRWQVPGEDAGAAVPLIDRGAAWDRDAPKPAEKWQAKPPTERQPQPGTAAEQWDGVERRRSVRAERTEPEAASVGDADDEPETRMAELLRLLADARPIGPPAGPRAVAQDTPKDQPPSDELPSTDELLARLIRASVRRAEVPAPPSPARGGAAAELAHAMAVLRSATN